MTDAIFISHGAPTLALEPGATGAALAALARDLPRPEAILVASAHWETAAPVVSTASVLPTIHDFSGFPAPLYAMRYPAHGDPALGAQVCALLSAAGLKAGTDATRGLDHGAWVPLRLMYPKADIPVIQISIQPHLGPAHHFALGSALAALRGQRLLLIGSGSITHNLRELDWSGGGAEARWALDFRQWIAEAIEAGRTEDLLDYRRRAPQAARNHPTDEHLLPLFVPLGLLGKGGRGRRIHEAVTFGSLGMDAYRFELSD